MFIEAMVSGLQRKLSGMVPVRATPGMGSVAVAWAEGEGDEATRAGIRFRIQSSAATGIAPVQALPTTAASWLLYNPLGNPASVFFDELGEWLVSGTAGAGGTVLHAMIANANLPSTLPVASSASVLLPNANPKSGRTSQLIVVASQTLQGTTSWAPLAWMNPAGTVLGQTQMLNADIRGKIALAPGAAVALAVISPTGTTPLFAPFGSFREYVSDME